MNSIQVAPLTPVVKKLVITICLIWFVIQIIGDRFLKLNFSSWFILHPDQVIEKFWIWQLFTYIFFHSATQVTHILFNLLMLWFFGGELEKHWGARFFTIYFFVCGVGAAILY